MTPRGTKDPEYPWDLFSRGKRRDGRDLTKDWLSMKAGKVKGHLGDAKKLRTDVEAVVFEVC